MASALLYLFAALVVGAVVFLLASVVFGRGEQLESLPPGATPTRLPSSGVDGSDVRALRFQQVLRGYKASEVDWALERVAGELEEVHGRVAVLERQLAAAEEQLHRAHDEQSDAANSAEGWPGTGQPDTGQSGTGQPGTGQPGTGQSGTGQPGTGQPGTGQSE